MVTSKVGMTKQGQFLTTIPKSVAEMLRLWKGDNIEWTFVHGDVVIRKK